MILTDRKKRCD